MISSVEGWIVSPRKSRKKSACFSRTTTSTPARASRNPSIMPAGPPPAMQHRVRIDRGKLKSGVQRASTLSLLQTNIGVEASRVSGGHSEPELECSPGDILDRPVAVDSELY